MFIAHDPSLGTQAPLGAKYDAPGGAKIGKDRIITINITSLRDLLRVSYGVVSFANLDFFGGEETTLRWDFSSLRFMSLEIASRS